jgi:rare lipoprotein A
MCVSACATHETPKPVAAEPAAHGTYKVGQPYKVGGSWYYPAEDLTYDETGIASWYGPGFHEHATANGELFDQNLLTAAHKTLPLPSIVQITNLDNGRSIEVRVNDRGPYVDNRIIDCSRRTAQLLGFDQAGTAKVRVRVLVPETLQAQSIAKLGGQDTPPLETPQAAPRGTVVAQALPPPNQQQNNQQVAAAPPPAADPRPQPKPVEQPLPETVKVVPVGPAHLYVQAGAFSNGSNAQTLKSKLAGLGPVTVTGAKVNGVSVYRVRVGPVASIAEADSLLERTHNAGAPDARIVVD